MSRMTYFLRMRKKTMVQISCTLVHADQHVCFFFYCLDKRISKSEILNYSHFLWLYSLAVSELVVSIEDRFSYNLA